MVAKRSGAPTKALKNALNQVRNLIERLRASDSSESDEFRVGGIMFYIPKLGGIYISGDEARHYRECLESLVALHGINADIRALSRSATENLLRSTILRTLRPFSPSTHERMKFQRRLDRELRRMRMELEAAPKEWNVTVQVGGFDPDSLPLAFGGVNFVAGTPDAALAVAGQLADFNPKGAVAKVKRQAEQRAREQTRAQLAESFAGASIATVTVSAVDSEAAKHIGIERIRRTIDVINYFASHLESPSDAPKGFVAPEGHRTALAWFVCRADGEYFSWSCPVPYGASVTGAPISIDPASPRAIRIGFSRADQILSKSTLDDFESRVVNALGWAGRASVEYRRDMAFLLFMISLEALLTKRSARGGVTDRLRLRLAHLIGPSPDARKRVFDLVGRLYDARSALVHAGDSADLTDADLQLARRITQGALTCALTDPRFASMRHASEFERWLDDQLLVGKLPSRTQNL